MLTQGADYWRYYLDQYYRLRLQSGYPRRITDDFKGKLPSTVDSAFVWGKNGRVYIVEGKCDGLMKIIIQFSMDFRSICCFVDP